MRRSFVLTAMIPCLLLSAAQSLAQAPWEGHAPIVTVKKELYQPAPGPGLCLWCWSYNVGPDGERVENYLEEGPPKFGGRGDDRHFNSRRRFSSDHGVTWSPMEDRHSPPHRDITYIARHGNETQLVQDGRLERPFYDAETGVVVRFYDNITDLNEPHHHTFVDLSNDCGHTYGGQWNADKQTYTGPAKLVKYEPGADPVFDKDGKFADSNYFDKEYKLKNKAYPGNNTIRLRNGTLVTAITETNVMIDGKVISQGCRCLIGKWNAQNHNYDWEVGAPAHLSKQPYGFYEGHVAELKDGRILFTWRTETGHRYYAVSEDGGKTISQPAPLMYSDGSVCYSPASISGLIRSSKTGKLYFLGNISAKPLGLHNATPRHPLVIAEIDETGTPAIKKDTVTVIDDVQPGEDPAIQLSNFSFLENRKTHQIELHVSPLNIKGTNQYEAPVRKYTVTFVSDGR